MALEGNAFFFQNYIIGRPDTRLSAMTIGAEGVKIYQNLPSAQIVNATLTADYAPLRWLTWKNRLTYSYGRESSGARLPLIAPLTYQGSLQFLWHNLTAQCSVRLATRNSHCGTLYGETPTPGYAVWNLNIGSHFRLARLYTEVNLGVENLFNRHYSTYSDWNHIPQKGRNIYINTAFQL